MQSKQDPNHKRDEGQEKLYEDRCVIINEHNEEIGILNGDVTSNWRSISNGVTHACGVKTNGSLFSWGTGLCGQLGQSVDRINMIHKFYQIGTA